MGFGPELQTYQVGAHFEALINGFLVAPLKKSSEIFFGISSYAASLLKITLAEMF